MTGAELMYVVGFFITVFGSIFGVWRYLDGKLTANRKDTEKVAQDLAAHRLHIAETYVTKAGMHEQTSQIMKAIEGVGSRIDGLGERLDRLYENQPRRTTRG